jgi:hypothetical protein
MPGQHSDALLEAHVLKYSTTQLDLSCSHLQWGPGWPGEAAPFLGAWQGHQGEYRPHLSALRPAPLGLT